MTRATASAPSNIAFVKYWGAESLEEVRPANPSISMTLSRCRTTTTVEHDPAGPTSFELRILDADDRETPVSEGFRRGVGRHLEALRPELGLHGRLSIVTRNSFPSGAGIASSASGFAALALAASGAAGREISAEEHSRLARVSGSGSASRSAWGGYVEWPGPSGHEAAAPLASADHWTLCDLVAVVDAGPKGVSSREGHRRAASSPHFSRRLSLIPDRLEGTRAAIRGRDLEALGDILEAEAIELHLVAMSSNPPIFYWKPATLAVLARVRELRSGGLGAWSTLDAGANVHVLCAPEDESRVTAALSEVEGVHDVLRDRTGDGPHLLEEHLS